MSITTAQIAKRLSISPQEAMRLLQKYGIEVTDVNAVLDKSDLQKIRHAIQKIKKQDRKRTTPSLAEKARKDLRHCLTHYKVFIDTCSLLNDSAAQFWSNAVPLLEETGNKIIITTKVVEELEKHYRNQNNPPLAKKAATALEYINVLLKSQLVVIQGEQSDVFADNVFQVVFTKFRMTERLLLITQDQDLATDILNLNNNKSVRANRVYVKRINQFGYLSYFSLKKRKAEPAPRLRAEEKFSLSKNLTTIPAELLITAKIPTEGEVVYARHETQEGPVQLLEEMASGGEGRIFTTNTPYLAKIYKEGKLSQRKYEKIKLMLSKKINCTGICYPQACLYNKDKQFVGYLMPRAQGKELQKCLFIKPLLFKNFPHWKKRDTVELCITILEKIKYLHSRNIIIGDINPANILLVSPTEVYFVDTDSYQIEGFPCPVGTINYTAPEIQRKTFATFLRSYGNEYFAVATLLFMIMLPGKPPYSQQGGENPIDNIIKMDFSYPLGDLSNKKTPDGPWRFIWSHLPFDIKSGFYHTFRRGGDYSTENNRLNVEKWLNMFQYYLQLLDSGKYGMRDKMSEDLFPTRYQRHPDVTYARCKLCGKEVPANTCREGICPDCLNTGEVHHCRRCGKEILFTNYQKYIRRVKPHSLCPECYSHGKKVYARVRCINCGRYFQITNSEYEYFRSKNLHLPKRCKQCRKLANRTYSPPRRTYPTPTRRTPTGPGKGSLCFLTTAICNYLQKEDNCYELTILRKFRDDWLKKQPGGHRLITEYYFIAPDIVCTLAASPSKDKIYNRLWRRYIKPCVAYIETGEFTACKKKYMAMVRYLQRVLPIKERWNKYAR